MKVRSAGGYDANGAVSAVASRNMHFRDTY
jgi:hypothetical protein